MKTKKKESEFKLQRDYCVATHSSSSSRPGMYSRLTSNTTGLFGATLGLPGADVRPFGNANYRNTKIKKNYDVMMKHEIWLM